MGTEEIEDLVLPLKTIKTYVNKPQLSLNQEQRDHREYRDNYLEQNQSPSSYNKLDRPRYRSITPPHGNNQPNDEKYVFYLSPDPQRLRRN
jgi:hypothetical protein